MSPALLAAVLPACLAGAAVALLLRAGGRLPHAAVSSRGLHGAPVPRVGGLAIWAGFYVWRDKIGLGRLFRFARGGSEPEAA